MVMYTASAEDAALEVAGPKEVSPWRLSVRGSAYAIMNYKIVLYKTIPHKNLTIKR